MDRGPLRVYLGAAAGVGKTLAMLDEGHRRYDRGTDVVVGYVETHGRPKTAAKLHGLELIPRKQIDYNGTILEEMDLEAILRREPTVVLVDELAHTNVPGSLHEKRWQAIETLRDAGIEVITTVNVQHLDSLNDVTESITGVRQRETVPDDVVRSANQIELIDMSPQALRRRMAHGNIYTAEKVDAALANYFREGNLTALRELALLWLADRVEEGLESYRSQHEIDSTWAARERIVVAISGGPESIALMRRAARISARQAGGEWQALFVTRDDGLNGVAPDRLAELRSKAEDLGGTLHTVVGDAAAATVLAFARGEDATQLLLGASRRRLISGLLRPGLGERVIAGAGEIDIHIVTHDYAHGRGSRRINRDALGLRRQIAGYMFSVAGPLLVSLILWQTKGLRSLPIEAMALVVIVVATALIGGLLPAIVAALLSGFLLNYLFTPPLYTLTIAQPENIVTIALFIIVGIAVAVVVDGAARQTERARAARAEADALTALSHSLLNSSDNLTGLLNSACELFGAAGAAVLRSDETGKYIPISEAGEAPATPDAADLISEINGHTVLVMAGTALPADQRSLLNAYAAYAKVMIERRDARLVELDRLRLAETDPTRTALLGAISHDLRSPQVAMRVAVDSLRSTDVQLSPEDEAALLETIDEATGWLNSLVANLLDMSHIHAGDIRTNISEVSVQRAVRDAVAALPGAERIHVDLSPNDVILADAGLLDRVIANIANNALKHTPTDAVIRIDSAHTPRQLILRIADHGPSVTDHQKLFAPFQQMGDVPRNDGAGLGLAVAKGLTEAMGGSISTEDTPGGGLTFVLDLPTTADPALRESP